MKMNSQIQEQLCVMPDGRLAPSVMTADECCEFLRIESGNRRKTLSYYQTKGLKGVRVGRQVRFMLFDVVSWLKYQQKKIPC